MTYTRLNKEKPINKLMEIENQMKSLLSLLVGWAQYTEILYLPDDQIETLISKDSYSGNIDEMNKKFEENIDDDQIKNEKRTDVRLEKLKELMKLRRINEGKEYFIFRRVI